MQYDDVVSVFFAPPVGVATPSVMTDAGPARRLRDGIEAIGMHAVWSRSVHEMLAGHGLDFFGGYLWGRAASLGDPTGAVVAATFGAFEPAMIGGAFEAAHPLVSRARLLADLDVAVGASLRAILGDDDVSGVVAALRRAVDNADGTGKPLFSGVRELGWPDDQHTALWRACLALREYRGDAHIAVYVAAGFDAVRMNILTELWAGYGIGEYSGSRAWSAERTQQAVASLQRDGYLDGEAITERGRQVRDGLEAATDRLCQPLVNAIGADADHVIGHLKAWGDACIAAAAFPPDPRKLACG